MSVNADFIADAIAGYIEEFYAEHGEPPTVREIAAETGLSSTGHVHFHLRRLEAHGRVRRGFRGWLPPRERLAA